jgi:regulator of protease activity HflC (stomatin/prohibitin superfamily)
MDEQLIRQLIQLGKVLAPLVSALTLVVVHILVLLYYRVKGRQRGSRIAIAYLAMFDWAMIVGITAGRSVAGEDMPFWSSHTVMWGLLGALLLFLPAWLLFQFSLRMCGMFLLPVMPTDREGLRQAGRALHAYAHGSNYPFYREEDGKLSKRVDGRIMLRDGGPGFVIADSHYAIPITAGVQDTRVGGQGFVFTGRRERPRSPVDLQLQIRGKTVEALTRDGIPVKTMLFAVFQIDRRQAEGEGLYPFDSQAVFAATRAQGVGDQTDDEEREEIGWDQLVVDRAADLLRDVIATKLLDRLLESEGGNPPRQELSAEITERLGEAMESLGIHVLFAGLGNIEVQDEEVIEQRVQSWAAHWERRRLEREALGDAEAMRLIQEARAEAQRQMIRAITEAFQQLADTRTRVPTQIIALRFIDILEDLAASPAEQGQLPGDVQGLLGQLRALTESTPSDSKSATAQ